MQAVGLASDADDGEDWRRRLPRPQITQRKMDRGPQVAAPYGAGARVRPTHAITACGSFEPAVFYDAQVLVSVNIAIYSSFAVTYKNGPIVYNPINQRYSRKNTDGSRTINHAVNLVGYGRTKVEGRMMQYWKVLNSLSTKWGEGGFFRMELNAFMGGIKQIDPCWAKDVEPGKDFVCLGLPGYNYWQHGGYTTREKPDCTVYTKPPKCQDQDPNYKNNPRFAKAYKDYQNGGCSSAAY